MRLLRLAPLAALLALAPLAGAATPPDTVTVVVMGTTDLHGWVLPWDYYTDAPEPRFGLAKVATLVDSVRARHPHTLLLDAGDWLQGNPLADYSATVDTETGYPLLQAADVLGYDAIVIGNHEFNFGIELLEQRIAEAASPIIAANVYHHSTEDPAFAPYVIREVGGIRVAIVGLTTPGSAVWDRPRVQGRLDFGDGLEAAHRFVAEVRQRGADVVVVLAHTGLEGDTSYFDETLGPENFGRAVVEQVRGVDAVVLGHTHRVTEEILAGPDRREVAVIQAGRWGSHLALAELAVARDASGEARVVARAVRVHPTRHAEAHPAVEALAAEVHAAVRTHMAAPLATVDEPWFTRESRAVPTAAIDLIHQVQLAATGAQLSAAAAFNTGVTLGPGPITLGQVAQLYPYENALYVVEISGGDLRAFLEHSARYYQQAAAGEAPQPDRAWPGYNFDMIAGARYVLDLTRPAGERVSSLTFEGRPVADGDTFTMAVNSYRAEGGGGFPGMAETAIVQRIDTSVRDLIVEFLRQRGTLTQEDVRISDWRITPRPAGD